MELKKKTTARRARSKELRMRSMKSTLSNDANDFRMYPVSHDQNFFKQQITEEKQL